MTKSNMAETLVAKLEVWPKNFETVSCWLVRTAKPLSDLFYFSHDLKHSITVRGKQNECWCHHEAETLF